MKNNNNIEEVLPLLSNNKPSNNLEQKITEPFPIGNFDSELLLKFVVFLSQEDQKATAALAQTCKRMESTVKSIKQTDIKELFRPFNENKENKKKLEIVNENIKFYQRKLKELDKSICISLVLAPLCVQGFVTLPVSVAANLGLAECLGVGALSSLCSFGTTLFSCYKSTSYVKNKIIEQKAEANELDDTIKKFEGENKIGPMVQTMRR